MYKYGGNLNRDALAGGAFAALILLILLAMSALCAWNIATCTKWEPRQVQRTHCYTTGSGTAYQRTTCDTRMETEYTCVERAK